MDQDNNTLLEGVRLTAEFLLDAEADCLCGAPRHIRSPLRMNYRRGCHKRLLRLKVGTVRVRMPNLAYLHIRPSMAKRFRRLEDDFVAALRNVYANGACIENVAPLVRLMWTMSLADDLHAQLTAGLCKVLMQWRGVREQEAGWLGGDIFGVI